MLAEVGNDPGSVGNIGQHLNLNNMKQTKINYKEHIS